MSRRPPQRSDPDGAAAVTSPLVTAVGVTRRFGHVVAVADMDFRVHPGEVVGLLGANGAGKTTFIRILLGLLPATSGTVELFGTPPSRSTRRLIGYVPQGLGLWEDLTAAENLAFSARAFGATLPASLDSDLQAARDTLVRDLPLGLRRRLAFAAALAHDPLLLVLDEPTSGVDPLARARLWDTIRSAADAGAGALVTTHYMDEAEQCDRLVIMADARVVAADTVAALTAGRHAVEIQTADWATAFATLVAADTPVALRGRRLRVPDGDPRELLTLLQPVDCSAVARQVPATLEEVFIELTTRPAVEAVP